MTIPFKKPKICMTTPRFILASSSPRRKELLSSLGVEYTIIKPEIDETRHPHEHPHTYVQRLSREKAHAVAQNLIEPAAILAADTVVILAADTIGIEQNGELLGKPSNADDARGMLQRLCNRPHQVCTAFTLLKTGVSPKEHTEMVCTTVHMRDYSDAEIDAYIATGDPFDKAGSYAIQHEGFHPVDRIEGSYSNVVGLPIEAVEQALRGMGMLE